MAVNSLLFFVFYLIWCVPSGIGMGHPDCDHKRVFDHFFSLCNSYFPSMKREANILADLTQRFSQEPFNQVLNGLLNGPVTQHQYNGPFIPRLTMPNEPEDFMSFNSWYLNPIYASADWQSPVERWRRKNQNKEVKEKIWHFVRNKCCVTGCIFPEDYWELDKELNICGMRR